MLSIIRAQLASRPSLLRAHGRYALRVNAMSTAPPQGKNRKIKVAHVLVGLEKQDQLDQAESEIKGEPFSTYSEECGRVHQETRDLINPSRAYG